MAGGNGFQVETKALGTYQTDATNMQNGLDSALGNNQVPAQLDFGQLVIRDLPGAEQLAQAYTTLVRTYIQGGGGSSGSAGAQQTGVPLIASQLATLAAVAGNAKSYYDTGSANEAQAAQIVHQALTGTAS